MLINVKMPTIVGILTFMSMINLVLSSVKHGKGFITLRPGLYVAQSAGLNSICSQTVQDKKYWQDKGDSQISKLSKK